MGSGQTKPISLNGATFSPSGFDRRAAQLLESGMLEGDRRPVIAARQSPSSSTSSTMCMNMPKCTSPCDLSRKSSFYNNTNTPQSPRSVVSEHSYSLVSLAENSCLSSVMTDDVEEEDELESDDAGKEGEEEELNGEEEEKVKSLRRFRTQNAIRNMLLEKEVAILRAQLEELELMEREEAADEKAGKPGGIADLNRLYKHMTEVRPLRQCPSSPTLSTSDKSCATEPSLGRGRERPRRANNRDRGGLHGGSGGGRRRPAGTMGALGGNANHPGNVSNVPHRPRVQRRDKQPGGALLQSRSSLGRRLQQPQPPPQQQQQQQVAMAAVGDGRRAPSLTNGSSTSTDREKEAAPSSSAKWAFQHKQPLRRRKRSHRSHSSHIVFADNVLGYGYGYGRLPGPQQGGACTTRSAGSDCELVTTDYLTKAGVTLGGHKPRPPSSSNKARIEPPPANAESEVQDKDRDGELPLDTAPAANAEEEEEEEPPPPPPPDGLPPELEAPAAAEAVAVVVVEDVEEEQPTAGPELRSPEPEEEGEEEEAPPAPPGLPDGFVADACRIEPLQADMDMGEEAGPAAGAEGSAAALDPRQRSLMLRQWGEVELLLRKPIGSNEDVLTTLGLAEAGLVLMDALDRHARQLNVLRGALARWLLPFDTNTAASNQASITQAVIENEPDVLRGKLSLSEIDYLVCGVNSVRALIRVKIADDADLDQARTALETAQGFLSNLMNIAGDAELGPYDLLSSALGLNKQQDGVQAAGGPARGAGGGFVGKLRLAEYG